MGSTARHSSRAQLRSPHCPPGQLPAPSILTSPSADFKFIYFSVSLWQEGEAFLTHVKGGVHQGGQNSQAEEAQWGDTSPRNQRICRNTTNHHLSHMQAELNFFCVSTSSLWSKVTKNCLHQKRCMKGFLSTGCLSCCLLFCISSLQGGERETREKTLPI